MKNENGYGTVYKLSGNRRNPYIARKTKEWKIYDRLTKETLDTIPEGFTGTEKLSDGRLRFSDKRIYEVIGYYPTRSDAMFALAYYNKHPYDLHIEQMTLAELYDKWSERYLENTSKSNINGVKASWKILTPLHNMKVIDLKLDHFQKVLDESGKHSPTLKKVRITLGLMYDYAVKHEILSKDKRDMIRYIDISKAGNPNAIGRDRFTDSEIKTLWKRSDSSEYIRVILMLIYTGVRVSELLNLKKEDVHINEQWFFVKESKTKAGIRIVPIADKVLPFFQEWYSKNDCEYLLSTPEGKHFKYDPYYSRFWKPFMKEFQMSHRPHDTRHTFETLLTLSGVDDKIMRRIVGHEGLTVGERVYTHFGVDTLIKAVNEIQI